MALFSSQIATKKMVPVCRQMASSYEAGIPIVRTLELVGNGIGDKKTREVLQTMAQDIQRGASLADAARKHPKYLPPFFVELLAGGESSGRLNIMLKDLADYYEDRLALRRSIIGASIYPSLQLTAAWFLGTFALGLVSQLGEPNFSLDDYFISYGFFQLKAMIVLAIVFFACVGLSRAGLFQYVWGWLVNAFWPINNVTRKFALARFFRSMSLLIESGMHIKSCIINSAAMTANPYIRKDLMQAAPLVGQGATLVQAFAPCRSLTPTAREMLAVGEESGQLDVSLRKVSEYHLAEANHAVKVATTVLGIAILVAMALLVGYIIISFYAKLYGSMFEQLNV